jgi:hypothetical protein
MDKQCGTQQHHGATSTWLAPACAACAAPDESCFINMNIMY